MTLALRRFFEQPYFIPGCFIVFFVIRAWLALSISLEADSDSLWYINRAIAIAAGEGYTQRLIPTAYWPVGYPGFLGVLFTIFGPNEFVGVLANIVLASLSFFLVLYIARGIFEDEVAARIAVALLTFYPNHIGYTPALLTELYFTFLVLLGTFLIMRYRDWRWTIVVGLIFGLATLTKSQVIFFPLALLALRCLMLEPSAKIRKFAIHAGVLIFAISAVVVPWTIRNYHVFGEFILVSTNGGMVLLTGNHLEANGTRVKPGPELMAIMDWSVEDQVAADKRGKKLAIELIKEHPENFIRLIPLKIWHLWARDGEAQWYYEAGFENYADHELLFNGIRIFNQLYYYLLLLGCLISMYLVVRNRSLWEKPWVSSGYLWMLYTTAIAVVFFGAPRYHFPVMPWVIIYAGYACSCLLQKRESRETVRGATVSG